MDYNDMAAANYHHPMAAITPGQTIYMPIESPPTPAPSPGPSSTRSSAYPLSLASSHLSSTSDPAVRRQILSSILFSCSPSELLFISTTIAPLLKRDFLLSLPPELSIHILSYVEDPKTLVRASMVSKHWYSLVCDQSVWKRMCYIHGFTDFSYSSYSSRPRSSSPHARVSYRDHYQISHITMTNWRKGGQLLQSHRIPVGSQDNGVVTSLALDQEWVVVGLANSKIHIFSATTGVLSRTLVGHEMGVWAVCLVSRGGWMMRSSNDKNGKGKEESGGMKDGDVETSGRRRSTGSSSGQMGMGVGGNFLGGRRRRREPTDGLRTGMERLGLNHPNTGGSLNIPPYQEQYVSPILKIALGLDESALNAEWVEEENGVDPEIGKRSDNCYASQGWGQPNALVVSGGCDKVLRVWDIKTGYCIYVLAGHTSTIRCIRVLHNRPIAVSGSRDGTVRVWDIQKGRPLRILEGHQHSVRCLDVCGNKIVSGSYDTTCRLWNADTGECLHILRGHYHEIYSVAFDGVRIASGGLDTTVRVWDAQTGDCVALLQGHTALVCQLQLSPTILATGGSDGRVITFDLSKYTVLHRIAAHDSSVTSLQFDKNFLVTGGNDGRVRLFETATGNFVRDLSEVGETVWKVGFGRDVCAIMCRRAGKTVMEIWGLRAKIGV